MGGREERGRRWRVSGRWALSGRANAAALLHRRQSGVVALAADLWRTARCVEAAERRRVEAAFVGSGR